MQHSSSPDAREVINGLSVADYSTVPVGRDKQGRDDDGVEGTYGHANSNNEWENGGSGSDESGGYEREEMNDVADEEQECYEDGEGTTTTGSYNQNNGNNGNDGDAAGAMNDDEAVAVDDRYLDDVSDEDVSGEDGPGGGSSYRSSVGWGGGGGEDHYHFRQRGGGGEDGLPMTVLDAFYGGEEGEYSNNNNDAYQKHHHQQKNGSVDEDTSKLSDEEFAHLCDKNLSRGRADIDKVEGLIARFDSTKDELHLPSTDAVLLEKYILDPVTVGLLEFKDYYQRRLGMGVKLVRAMRADAENGGWSPEGGGDGGGGGGYRNGSEYSKQMTVITTSTTSGSNFNHLANRRRSTGIGRLVTTETGDGKAYVTVMADNGQQMTFTRPASGTDVGGGGSGQNTTTSKRILSQQHQQSATMTPRGAHVPITDLSEDLDLMMGLRHNGHVGMENGGGGESQNGMKALTKTRCVLQLVKTLNILIAHREATLHALETIAIREATLNEVVVLAEANERGDRADDVEVAVVLHRLLYNLQRSTLNVVDAISKWREGLCVPRPFICGFGHNYIHKIVSDCKALGELDSVNRALPMQQLFCRYPLMSNLPSISLYALTKESEKPFRAAPPPSSKSSPLANTAISNGTSFNVKGGASVGRPPPSAASLSNTTTTMNGATVSRRNDVLLSNAGTLTMTMSTMSDSGKMGGGGSSGGGASSPTKSNINNNAATSSKYKLYTPLGAPPVDPTYQRRIEAAEHYIHSETDRLLAGVHILLKLCHAGEFLPVANIAPICPALRKQVSLYNQSILTKLDERAAAVRPNATGGGGGVKKKNTTTSPATSGGGKQRLPRVTCKLPEPPVSLKGLVPSFRFTSGIRIGNRELQEDYEAILLEYISVLQTPPFRAEYDEWKSKEDQKVDNSRKYKAIRGKSLAGTVNSMAATMGGGESPVKSPVSQHPTRSGSVLAPSSSRVVNTPQQLGGSGIGIYRTASTTTTTVDRTSAYRRSSVSLTGPLIAMPPAKQSTADRPQGPPQ